MAVQRMCSCVCVYVWNVCMLYANQKQSDWRDDLICVICLTISRVYVWVGSHAESHPFSFKSSQIEFSQFIGLYCSQLICIFSSLNAHHIRGNKKKTNVFDFIDRKCLRCSNYNKVNRIPVVCCWRASDSKRLFVVASHRAFYWRAR